MSGLATRVKAQVSLLPEVDKTVKYKRGAGGKMYACCPFHDDRTPSMVINSAKNYWRCHGCGESGSVIDWVMLRDSLSFHDALEYLCQEYGVTRDNDPFWDIQKARVKQNREKAKQRHEALASQAGPLDYLKSRHVSEETIATFQLGAVEMDWTVEIEGEKVSIKRPGVLIPFQNAWGDVVGFSVRFVDKHKPKYWNSSEGDGFDKGEQLFNLPNARRMMKQHLYVAEGYFDVVSAHQAGIPAVGICTSKLTVEQADLLARTCAEEVSIVLVPDQDKVGRDRCVDNIKMLEARAPKVPIYVVNLPGKDLGDLLGEPEKVQELLSRPMTSSEWLVRKALDDHQDIDAQMRAVDTLAKAIGNPIERDNLAHLLAGVWGKDLSVVREFLGTSKDRGRIDPGDLVSVGFSVLEFVNRGDGFHVGFPIIDKFTHGISGGEVFGIMARSGVGKTNVAVNIAHNLTVKYPDAPGIFFSMEMQRGPLELRLAQITFDKSREGAADYLTFGGEQELQQRYTNMLIVDKGGLSVDDLDEYIGQASGRRFGRGVDWVVIDYLGYLRAPRNIADGYQAVSHNARAIKQLAKKHNCAVFLLVQVSREKGGDGSIRIGMDAARDSGAIEESVDYMTCYWRPSLATPGSILPFDTVMCALAKNRNGSPAEVNLTFNTTSLRVYEGQLAQAKERTT